MRNEPRRRVWVHVRAALILAAIVIGLLDGAPIPPARKAPESLRPLVKDLGTLRGTLMKPFRPIGDLFKLRQTYKLFSSARPEQHRMWIEVRREGRRDWELVYRPIDPAHDLMEGPIEYRRLRGAWNPGNRGTYGGYGPFVEWLAGELFARDPDIRAVRVRHEKLVLRPREGTAESTGSFEHRKVLWRSRWERRARR
ncbi:MAG TPA: hypothetical protein VKZ63_05515 [Kofleriaceae bacterium]|nr:hypothetical protein [Kofleriaceae bacterium]